MFRRGRKHKPTEIHNTRGIMNAMQRIAKTGYNLTLNEVEGCTQPMTDMITKTVMVEPLNPYWPIEKLRKWKGEVYHEVGHHAAEVQDLMPLMIERKIGFGSLYGRMVNLIEDYRNERNNYGMFPGRDDDLSWTQAYYCAAGARALDESAGVRDADSRLFVDVMGHCYSHRALWQPDLAVPANDFMAHVITDYSWIYPELEELRTGVDVLNLVDKIFDASPDHDTEEEKEKAEKVADAEGSGADGKGDEKDGKADGGKSEPSDEDGDKRETEVSVSYEDLLSHKHESLSKGNNPSPLAKIEYDHARRHDYIPWKKMRVVKARDWDKCRFDGRVEREARKLYHHGNSLAASARRLFQSRTQRRVTHNHKSGRLDKRDLYRIPTGGVDVFKRKEMAPDPKGTALFILTDLSGSMSGTKLYMSTAAVALLNDTLLPLGVPVEIAAFTEDSDTGCQHYIIKEFNEKRSADDILRDYAKIAGEMCQNADGESIMWALDRLRARKEERKILLVLSDGSPAADNYGDCWTYTADAIAHASKFVECYGLGMEDDSVRDLYPESTVIDDVSKLEAALLDIIKAKIFTI